MNGSVSALLLFFLKHIYEYVVNIIRCDIRLTDLLKMILEKIC